MFQEELAKALKRGASEAQLSERIREMAERGQDTSRDDAVHATHHIGNYIIRRQPWRLHETTAV